MGDLDDSFTVLLGRVPTDREKQNLYRVRDALRLKSTDAVWLLLMALQHYETLYAAFPALIAQAAQNVTDTVRATAESQVRAAAGDAKKALVEIIREGTIKAARDTARAAVAKWVSVGVGVTAIALFLLTWRAFNQGEKAGRAVGENIAMHECGALTTPASWVATPEGKLAHALAQVGGLRDVAQCAGHGMVPRPGWCVVPSERGKVLARWPIPPSSSRPLDDRP